MPYRRHGQRMKDEFRCRARYDAATAGARARAGRLSRSTEPTSDKLHAATGDPLALLDRGAAMKAYSLDNAPRPGKALARLQDQVFGGALHQLAQLAQWFMRRRHCSALAAAPLAVALGAERGVWLGALAPLNFNDAVAQVRKATRRPNHGDDALGWTGGMLRIRPVAGRRVRDPVALTVIPEHGAIVRDTLFWRRRLSDGDVALVEPD